MKKIPDHIAHLQPDSYCPNCDRDYRGFELCWQVTEPYRTYSDPETGTLESSQGLNTYQVCSKECAEAYEYSLEWTGPMEG